MTRVMLPIVFFALVTGFVAVILSLQSSDVSGINRSIHIKGVFVLVDEVDMLARVKALSIDNPDRQEFMDKARLMFEGEPYVSSTSIRYSWPNDVVIEILETSPVAIINEHKLLSRNCEVVSKGNNKLPVGLIGFDTHGTQLDQTLCKRILKILPELQSFSVGHVDILANGDYVIDVVGSQLVFGEHEISNAKDQIRRMVTLIRTKTINAGRIDMRYISGVAVSQVAGI